MRDGNLERTGEWTTDGQVTAVTPGALESVAERSANTSVVPSEGLQHNQSVQIALDDDLEKGNILHGNEDTGETSEVTKQGFFVADLVLWILQVLFFSLFVAFFFIPTPLEAPRAFYFPLWIFFGLMLLIVTVAILVRAFKSETGIYLRNIRATSDAIDFMESFSLVKPVLRIKCECSHVSRDRDGSSSTTTSYKGETEFKYSRWVDKTTAIDAIDSARPLKMKLSLDVEFGDERTNEAFLSHERLFKDENQHRDADYRQWRDFTLPGMPDGIVIMPSSGRRWYYSFPPFLASHLLFMQYFYMLAIRTASDQQHFTFRKVVFEGQQV